MLDGRVKTAVGLLLAGGALLGIDQGPTGPVQLLGLLAVAQGASVTTARALGLLTVGATGYGLSLRFDPLAQRSLGAARTGSVFAWARVGDLGQSPLAPTL